MIMDFVRLRNKMDKEIEEIEINCEHTFANGYQIHGDSCIIKINKDLKPIETIKAEKVNFESQFKLEV